MKEKIFIASNTKFAKVFVNNNKDPVLFFQYHRFSDGLMFFFKNSTLYYTCIPDWDEYDDIIDKISLLSSEKFDYELIKLDDLLEDC